MTDGSASESWDLVADVVVVGAGATGLPAAIAARDRGATVILVEANYDTGGHAMLTGGNINLGGGTTLQRKLGIQDSPDLLFHDLTDWSVVQPNGAPDYRYNDREVVRALADNSPAAYDFLVDNGVQFEEDRIDNFGAHSSGNSVLREHHVHWTDLTVGLFNPAGMVGAGLVRPLERSARDKGVQMLFQYRVDQIARGGADNRVIGVVAKYAPKRLGEDHAPLRSHDGRGNLERTDPELRIGARQGVVLATGGSSSNVHFRTMIDPRLTEVYQTAGEPYSYQDASGELAAMAVGASLGGLANYTLEHGDGVQAKRQLGTRYNYFVWDTACPIFPLVKATGLAVKDWQNVILVNQVGDRFFDETAGEMPYGNHAGDIEPYVQGSFRNVDRVPHSPNKYNYFNAAAAINDGSAGPDYSAGPVWAIFDSDAVEREGWSVRPPHVDPDGYFFQADSLEELAALISNPYQRRSMSGSRLTATVQRYNEFVDDGVDVDFGKPGPAHKIARGPFFAAWATPCVHDSRGGLRINGSGQVLDMTGAVIPGLYCGGESAGGISQHGLGRCIVQGMVAGSNAAMEGSA